MPASSGGRLAPSESTGDAMVTLRSIREALRTHTGVIRSAVGAADRALLLSEASTVWLRTRLPGVACPWDLAMTYTFRHALIHSRKLVCQRPQPDRLEWQVDILDAHGASLLQGVLIRHVAPDVPLIEGGRGPVAFNDYFVLQEHAQAKGIATLMYPRERCLYKGWGIREIQLMAEWDGRVVWVKKRGFLPQDPALVARAYLRWAEQEGFKGPPPMNPADYPEPFLRWLPELPLYQVV